MNELSGDNEAQDRAIAHALDAAGSEGADDATVREYQEVLSHMPFDEIAPPAGLEDRIVAAATGRRPASVRPLRLSSARRRTTARVIAFGATAVAAAAVIAFALAPSDDNGDLRARIQSAASTDELEAVLAAEGTRHASLGDVGSIALSVEGVGYLYDLALEPSTGGYRLSLLTADDELEVGLFDATANIAEFTVTGDASEITGAEVRRGDEIVATTTL